MTQETTDKITKIAGVRFRENWKVYDFDAADIDLNVGDKVIVDSERGQGFASVVRIRKSEAGPAPEPPAQPASADIPEGIEIEIDGAEESGAAHQTKGQAARVIRKILRKATEEDIAKEEKNRQREAEAFSIAQDMISEREIPMKLIRVEYSFDASRATFYFFSENRVDFREIVKDLAHKLKSRIEMRQIGVRDVARMIGGFGPCGRELCCSSFLRNFEPVSIRMAKKQEMVLNPAKISGVCGRLLCCLSYEYEMYDANKKDLQDMRQSAKKEAEERRVAEERKAAEERKRVEERRQQRDQGREQQKEAGQKGSRPDRKRDQQEKKAQQSQPDRTHPPKPDKPAQQAQQQKSQQTGQEGEKPGKKKRRRFWRKKKKQGQGENKPPQAPNPRQG